MRSKPTEAQQSLAPTLPPGYNPPDVKYTRDRSLHATQGVQTG